MKKYVPLSIIFICVLLLIFYYIDQARNKDVLSASEKNSALTKILGRSPVFTQKNTDLSVKEFSGNLFFMLYPSSARIYSLDSSSSGKNVVSFGIPEDHTIISTQVVNFSQSLIEYPSVTIRHNQTNMYQETPTTFNNVSCLSYLKTQEGLEKSLFCEHDGKLLSFVVTSSDEDRLNKYFATFSSTIQF